MSKIYDVLNSPWAIIPEKLFEIQEIYKTHFRGEKIDIRGIETRIGISFQDESQQGERVSGRQWCGHSSHKRSPYQANEFHVLVSGRNVYAVHRGKFYEGHDEPPG